MNILISSVTMKEVVDAMVLFPPFLKDFAIMAVLLSLIQISPLKLNPWDWLKSFANLPKRIEIIESRIDRLETEFRDKLHLLERKIDNTDGFRWQSMILVRGDRIRRGEKFSEEMWRSTIETLDNYEKFCEKNKDWFKNGRTAAAIKLLREKSEEVYRTGDYLV